LSPPAHRAEELDAALPKANLWKHMSQRQKRGWDDITCITDIVKRASILAEL
jgi:hypothetical protein